MYVVLHERCVDGFVNAVVGPQGPTLDVHRLPEGHVAEATTMRTCDERARVIRQAWSSYPIVDGGYVTCWAEGGHRYALVLDKSLRSVVELADYSICLYSEDDEATAVALMHIADFILSSREE